MNLLDIFEGREPHQQAIDKLEQRRIKDLEARMDDCARRGDKAGFQKCKAERDSYHKVKMDEGEMKRAMEKDAERMSRDAFCKKYGNDDWVCEFWDNVNGPLDEAGIGQDIADKAEKIARATPQTRAGAVASTVKNAAKWLAGKGGPGKEGPTYEEEELDEKKLGQNRPKLGSARDIGKSVKKFRKASGLAEVQKKKSEEVDEDQARDLTAAVMLKKAHAAFPSARNAAEALSLWIADKEQRDVDHLEHENEQEEEMIARIIDQLKKTDVDEGSWGGSGPAGLKTPYAVYTKQNGQVKRVKTTNKIGQPMNTREAEAYVAAMRKRDPARWTHDTVWVAPADIDLDEEQKSANPNEFRPVGPITIVPPKKLKSGETYQDRNKYWQSQGQAPIYKTNEASDRVDPILIKALNNMPDGLASHGEVLNACYDAYAMELGKMAMKSEYGTTRTYIPQLMDLYKQKHGLTFNEAQDWQGNYGAGQAQTTDHTMEEAIEYVKGNYPYAKKYRVRRAEPGFRANQDSGEFNRSAAHVTDVDSAMDYLQLKENPVMSGSRQPTPSLGYSWHTNENRGSGIAVFYYEDRGMGWDEIIVAAKDKKNLAAATQVFRDAGVIPELKKKQEVAEDTGSWIVYDPATKQIKKRFKTHTAGKSYAKVHNLGFASSEYYFDKVKDQQGVAEEKTRLDPKCWTGKKIGNPKTKMKGGVRVNNCVPAEESYMESVKIQGITDAKLLEAAAKIDRLSKSFE